MKVQKNNTNITSILNDFYKPPKGKTSLKSENDLACFLGSILMFTGSICSFLSLHYFMNIDIAEIWFDSLVMFTLGIIILLILPIFKNEIIKSFVVSAIYS